MSRPKACKPISRNPRKKAGLLVAFSYVLLLASVTPAQAADAPEYSIPTAISQQVQRDLLEAQIADLQTTRAKDWKEARHKKAQYDQYVRSRETASPADMIPSPTIDRVAAEAQQATGRVEMADRILAALERHLNSLGADDGRREAVGAEVQQAVEMELLTTQQSQWQLIRLSEWETKIEKQNRYNEYVRQHPDHPVDRSGSEANIAIGRVEILDRLLDSHRRRLESIEKKMAKAGTIKTGATSKTATTVSIPGQPGWHRDGAPKTEKTLPQADACYPSSTLDISDGAATGIREWAECPGNPPKCTGTYVGSVTWSPPPAYLQPGKEVEITATAGTKANNTCGSRNFGSWLQIKLNGSNIVLAGESQYTGPPRATGKFTAPQGKPGDRMVIEVILQAASLNGKVHYTFVYR